MSLPAAPVGATCRAVDLERGAHLMAGLLGPKPMLTSYVTIPKTCVLERLGWVLINHPPDPSTVPRLGVCCTSSSEGDGSGPTLGRFPEYQRPLE